MTKKKEPEGPTPVEVAQAKWAELLKTIDDKGLSAQVGQRILREMSDAMAAL